MNNNGWNRMLMVGICIAILPGTRLLRAAERDGTLSVMRSLIEHETADYGSLDRRYPVVGSDARRDRMSRFYDDQAKELAAIDFPSLDQGGRIDYLLMAAKLRFEKYELARHQAQWVETAALLPFAGRIVELAEARQRGDTPDAEACAKALTEMDRQITKTRAALEEQLKKGRETPGLPTAVLANRTAEFLDHLRGVLREWNGFYQGYDPTFSWWMREAYPRTEKGLKEYGEFLKKKLAGSTDGDESPVIGDPIGREGLTEALALEMIAATPEELIAMAEKEWAWCEIEMKRAAKDLGCGEDWKAALAKVTAMHVAPGEQPGLIRELAQEATRFVEERGLVTVPPLCKETWRLEMMSGERQKVNPYFTGGEVISISFPTEDMAYGDKVMSLKGNNRPFCRATVFHELIPGHHLQAFMADRYNAHRSAFRTPFLIEGWALYWEMKLWDEHFPRATEERVGMLFWRSFRCQRVICSLKFHLGQMTAREWIDVLVDRVGHERRNATAEVRRSVNGSYSPLYQAAYLIGGLQLRSLHTELVGSGKMNEREFNDAVLRENSIPIEMVRASLKKAELGREWKAGWKWGE
jgi:uncharacterized protein (DUF885 family)